MLRFSIGINYLGVNHCKVKYSKNSSTTFFFKFEKIYIKVHTQNNSFFLFFFLFVCLRKSKKICFLALDGYICQLYFFVWDYFYQMLHQTHWYYCFVVYLGQVYYRMRLSHGCKNLYIFVFPDMSSLCQPILSHLKSKFLY